MNITAYVCALIVLLALDAIWLGVIARDFYLTNLQPLLKSEPNWWAAALFYPMYVAGIMFFAVQPAHAKGSILKAGRNGALLGGLAYATYELTNLATLARWPQGLVVVDVFWGALLTAITAMSGYLAMRGNG